MDLSSYFINFKMSTASAFFNELEAQKRRGINEQTGAAFSDELIRSVLGEQVLQAFIMPPDDRFRVRFYNEVDKETAEELQAVLDAYPNTPAPKAEVKQPKAEKVKAKKSTAAPKQKSSLPEGIREKLFGLVPLSGHNTEAEARKIADGLKADGHKARVSEQQGKFIIYSNYKG